jgi:uncharacterized protein
MSETRSVNLRAFLRRARHNKGKFRRFLSKMEKDTPKGLNASLPQFEKEVWKEVDCLSCGNCCKTMTPTFNRTDIRRISAYLSMTEKEFREKWLKRERGGDRDWLNKSTPCQFLDLGNNMCRIYEVRPKDCAGFPHITKSLKGFTHVYKQNLEYCPAAYKMVEKMMLKEKHLR